MAARLRGMLGRGRLGASREQLNALSRDDLIDLVCSADQMLASRNSTPAGAPPPAVSEAAPASALPVESACNAMEPERGRKRRGESARLFDMSRYGQRWVALRLAYVGTRYSGMQYAEDVETVEGALFDALTKTRLITSKDDCGFSRGGRTDRGVSALGQVVALRLRSSVVPPPATGDAARMCSTGTGGVPLPNGERAASALAEAALAVSPDASMDVSPDASMDVSPDASMDVSGNGVTDASTAAAPALPPTAGEMDYVRVLNRVLPADIRIISWAPVPPDWSARFAASSRTYHYFFARSHYQLDAMREGARRLVGAHDYRNFCKVDPAVNSFERTIHSFEIKPVDGMRMHDGGMRDGVVGTAGGGELGAESLLAPWVFVINGSAFLWHQVRCMVAVLFLIGSGREQPSLIDALLDIRSHPARPTYEIAPDAPLLLYSIQYPGLQWTPHAPDTLAGLAEGWAREAEANTLRSAMLHTMRLSLLGATVPPPDPGSRNGGSEAAGGLTIPWRELLHRAGEGLPVGGWGARRGKYLPVLERPTADSLEERTATNEAKKARKEAKDTGQVAPARA